MRDVLDDAAPYHVAFAESWFVEPDAASVGDVVFDGG